MAAEVAAEVAAEIVNTTMCDEGMSSSEELVANILGIVGGLMLAVCLAPQLIQTWRTKSVDDVAYGWLGTYFIGLILNLTYFILIDAIVAYATLSLEITFCITMIILKVIYTTKPGADADDAAPEIEGAAAPDDKDAEPKESKLGRVTSLRFQGNFSGFTKTQSMRPKEDHTKYDGRHFLFDYTFERVSEGPGVAEAVLSLMKQACEQNGVQYAHTHIESFPLNDENSIAAPLPVGSDAGEPVAGKDSHASPDFYASLLTPAPEISRISAHCYPRQGILAFDVLAVGGRPAIARAVAKTLHAGVCSLPNFVDVQGRFREISRLPDRVQPRRGSHANAQPVEARASQPIQEV